jgi:inorganic pyrophosphatase
MKKGEAMSGSRLLQESKRFQIQAYRPPKNHRALRQTHVSFIGSPSRHPFDEEKVVLLVDPYSADSLYYEFRAEDIGFAEEVPNITTPEGDTVRMVRLWVKKGCIGIRSIPFVVEDTRR